MTRVSKAGVGRSGGLWFHAQDGTRCIAAARPKVGWEVTCEVHGEVPVQRSPASDLAVAVAISHVAREHGGVREDVRRRVSGRAMQ